MSWTRRSFLTASSASSLLALACDWPSQTSAVPLGDLVPDPDGLLDLPPGFSYTVVERVGDPMDDGAAVPGAPDGMACFRGPDGTLILMRNHELEDATGHEPQPAYSPESGGGVTRVVVDAQTGARISSNWVLAGTRRNCAGGPSPWGWLSCEESTEAGHGYVFACDPNADRAAQPRRIPGYGRFNHEAVAIDPATLAAYLTEDRADGCLYRFLPDDPAADPFSGRLQAMRVVERDGYFTGAMRTGDVVEVDWVDVGDPDPVEDDVRRQAQDVGAAVVVRGEGIWFFDGEVFFVSSTGGPNGRGQVFRLVDGPDGGRLECIAASTSSGQMNMPDNITVSPWGQVFLCEDADDHCRILAIDEDGRVRPFAHFAASGSELAGACFSPDGSILFVNAQADGYTFAIRGFAPALDEGDTEGDGDTDTEDEGETENEGDTTTPQSW